jgi:hypothetical protein
MAKKASLPQNDAELIQALIAQLEQANVAAAAQTGACLISSPGNPRPTCIQATPAQCRAINGVYVGGACPR